MELIHLITISVIITSILAIIAIAAHPKKWHTLSLIMSIIVVIVQVAALIISMNTDFLQSI